MSTKESCPARTRASGAPGWKRRPFPPTGYTIVELLVVIAIASGLLALLLPAIQSVRGSARRIQCISNVRQLSLAAHAYHAAREAFPPGLVQFETSTPPRFRGTSLFAFLLPHLDQGNVLRDWNYDAPLKNAEGGATTGTATVLDVFLCPSDMVSSNPVQVGDYFYGITSYGGNGGTRSYYPDHATADGVFHTTGPASQPVANQLPVTLSQIHDGTSHTLLFGERRHFDANYASFAEMHWTESLAYLGRWAAIGGRKRIADVTMSAFAPLNYRLPFDYERRSEATPPLNSSRDFAIFEDQRKCAFGSEHAGGANFAFADGSARFLADPISQAVLTAMCTRAGEFSP